MGAPLPENEAARLKTLRRYTILDTAPEAAFDDIVRLAAQLCRTPVAFLGLMDADRLWLKAQIGLHTTEIPRHETFCAQTLLQKELLRVPDARKDSRFARLPLTASRSGFRFYAGVPLIAPNGHALGTLGVMDPTARDLNPEQVESLLALARQTLALLELRRRTARPARARRSAQPGETALSGDARVRDILESLTDGFIALDRKWRYTYINANAARLIDLPPEEFLGKVIWDVFPETIGTPYYEALHRAMREQKPVHFEDYYGMRGGWFEYHVYPTKEGLAIYGRDVTKRKRAEDALRESEERFASVIRSMKEGLILVDSDGIIRLCNRSAEQILGLSARQVIGHKARTLPWRMIHEETAEFSGEAPAVLLSLCTGITLPDVTMAIPTPEAKLLWISVNSTPLFRAGETQPYAALATFTDITERKQNEQGLKQIMNQMDDYRMKLQRQKLELETVNARLSALASSDGLTGLKNRRAFRETLRHEFDYALRYRTPLSLILVDVDHFKEYNDAFGHPAGDEVLVRVAWILQANARSTDFVARYGGEEFIIVLPNTDRFGAITLAERFRLAIETASWNGHMVTASFGIASLTLTTTDPALLIGEADAALYASKKGGRNRTTHYDQLTSANPTAV
ncbi:MAG TPA: diguanylate cyclase [Chthonomonadaceae bacterium]|nr:diguanylate cyclase [Chthonomonadaceae bacterium]